MFSMLQHVGKAMGGAIYPAHCIASRIRTLALDAGAALKGEQKK